MIDEICIGCPHREIRRGVAVCALNVMLGNMDYDCPVRVRNEKIAKLEKQIDGLNLLKNEHFDMCEKLKKRIAARDTKIKDAIQNMRLAKEAMYQRMTGRDNPLSARIAALEECIQRLTLKGEE